MSGGRCGEEEEEEEVRRGEERWEIWRQTGESIYVPTFTL